MLANNLQNEIQFEFIINAIKEIRNDKERSNSQTIFFVTKTAVTNMDHGQIDELFSSMLKNGQIYDKLSKKGTS